MPGMYDLFSGLAALVFFGFTSKFHKPGLAAVRSIRGIKPGNFSSLLLGNIKPEAKMRFGWSVFRVLIDLANSRAAAPSPTGKIPSGTTGGQPVLQSGCLLPTRLCPLPSNLAWLGSGLFLSLFREEVPLTWGVCQASEP